MGLDVSHDCFSGSYGTFNRYREYLCSLVGIDATKMQGLCDVGPGLEWPTDSEEPICIMVNHSDCDGDIPKEDVLPLANRLKELLPKMENEERWKQKTEQWIEGLMFAHEEGDKVEFR